MLIESRGLHWTPSPRLSYVVLRTNYKPLGRDLDEYRAQFKKDEDEELARNKQLTVMSDFTKINKMTELQNFRNGNKSAYFDESSTIRPLGPVDVSFEQENHFDKNDGYGRKVNLVQQSNVDYTHNYNKENITPKQKKFEKEKLQVSEINGKSFTPHKISSSSGYSKGEYSRDNSPTNMIFANRKNEQLQSNNFH